jgi:hypothetical protein
LWKVPFQPHENVREAAIDRRSDIFLDYHLARSQFRAPRIDAHPDHRIAGQLSGQADMTSNSAGVSLRNGIGTNCSQTNQ